tara:strand:+ start:10166 stop:11116 length:951 start_codon:yes stop_codon:yes gene_type:complete
LISLIIPNYNKDLYLKETISSIQNQSLQEWECIVIDDNSTDNSLEIINNQTRNDSRFLVLQNKVNKGACYCRNIGIEKARGDYIMFLDSDDIISKSCLVKRFNEIKKNIKSDFLVFPMGTFYNKIGDSNYIWNNFSGDHLRKFLSHNLPWAVSSLIWKKSFLIKIGGFNESIKRLQDVDLHTRSLLYNKIIYKTFPSHKPDCYYRISDDRIKNFYDFAKNDINGKIDFIKYFSEKTSYNNIKYLKGTYFECFNLPFNFYFKGYINLSETNKLVSYILDEFKFKFIDLIILKVYIKARINKFYIKGFNTFFKFVFIR